MVAQPAFTPFLPPLHDALFSALRQLLGLPTSVTLQCRVTRSGEPPVLWARCVIGEGDAALRVDVGPTDTNGSRPGGPLLRARWHLPTQPDPVLMRLQRGLEARIAQSVDSCALVRAALDALAPFAGQTDELFRKASDSAFGPYGLLRVSFLCNQNCGFCWQGRDWPAPPPELYLTWLEELAIAGLRTLLVTGGEPTLWPLLPKLVERATRDHGMHVLLETNAIRFRQPTFVEQMQQAGLKTLFVSWHTPDAETSDRMTRAPRTYQGTEKGIAAWLQAGGEVQLNCVIQPDNLDQLPEHGPAIVERFVRPYPQGQVSMVTYTQPAPYHDRALFAEALVPLEEIAVGLAASARALQAAGVALQVDGSCGFPTCLASDVPGLMRWQPALQMADSDAQSRGYAEVCERCAARPGCLGVRREYLARWGARGLQPFAQLPPELAAQRDAMAAPKAARI